MTNLESLTENEIKGKISRVCAGEDEDILDLKDFEALEYELRRRGLLYQGHGGED